MKGLLPSAYFILIKSFQAPCDPVIWSINFPDLKGRRSEDWKSKVRWLRRSMWGGSRGLPNQARQTSGPVVLPGHQPPRLRNPEGLAKNSRIEHNCWLTLGIGWNQFYSSLKKESKNQWNIFQLWGHQVSWIQTILVIWKLFHGSGKGRKLYLGWARCVGRSLNT